MKTKLKNNASYRTVYVERELSAEARAARGNLTTVIKATGMDKEYTVRGVNVVKRKNNNS